MGFKKIEVFTGNPWDKQPDESAEQFNAFVMYRDADPKISTEKVAAHYQKSTEWAAKLCTARRWVERREKWTEYQGKLTTEELVSGIPKMRKTHTDIATSMLVKALKALQKLPIEEMSPRDISTMVDVAAKLERISRGEVTERRESKTEIAGELKVTNFDFSDLSDDELNRLDEIVNKISSA